MTPPSLLTLRHRTVPSSEGARTSGWWEFFPRGGFPEKPNRILISVDVGRGDTVEAEVPVCTHCAEKADVPGKWILLSRGEAGWLLTSAKMPDDLQQVSHRTAFHPDLPIGSISLTGAPDEVNSELSRI